MRVPDRGPERWAAERPYIGGPVYGAIYGLFLGIAIGVVSSQSWRPLIATVPVGVLLGVWRIGAMRRALTRQGGTPYEA
jgi:hypothetical protein